MKYSYVHSILIYVHIFPFQLVHILQLVVKHYKVYYPVRHHLIQHVVSSIQRLGFTATATIEQKRLAVERTLSSGTISRKQTPTWWRSRWARSQTSRLNSSRTVSTYRITSAQAGRTASGCQQTSGEGPLRLNCQLSIAFGLSSMTYLLLVAFTNL